jgi:transposase
MLIQGCDYHPSMQPIAFVDTETGERGERRRTYRDGEAERFYRELKQRQIEVRVGREATGLAGWFERWLAELGASTSPLMSQPRRSVPLLFCL